MLKYSVDPNRSLKGAYQMVEAEDRQMQAKKKAKEQLRDAEILWELSRNLMQAEDSVITQSRTG